MQLFEICSNKHMLQCSFKAHNSSYVRQKSVQWFPLSSLFFFWIPLRFRASVAKHIELMFKSLNRYIASS